MNIFMPIKGVDWAPPLFEISRVIFFSFFFLFHLFVFVCFFIHFSSHLNNLYKQQLLYSMYFLIEQRKDYIEVPSSKSRNCFLFVVIHFTCSIHLLSGLPVFTKVQPSPATPAQRSTFQAVCQAEGFPRPVINWRRVGISLPAGRTEVNRGILTIKNMILADSGLYECIATNTVGTKKVRTNVVVQRKPGELLLPYWYLISCFSRLWKNHEIIDPCWIKVSAKFKRGKLNANLKN